MIRIPCKAKLCTWEFVGEFDEVPEEHLLRKKFQQEFPNTVSTLSCRFLRMTSFNGQEGRRHRFLVAAYEEKILQGHRRSHKFFPAQIFLFAIADEKMRAVNGCENYKMASIVGDVLYILVFVEGRLSHWSEENGYGEENGLALANERLVLFDGFLKEDSLLSSVEYNAWDLFRYERNPWELCTGEKTFFRLFCNAAKDHFWKGFDLKPEKKANNRKVPLLYIKCSLFLLVAGGSLWWNVGNQNGTMETKALPIEVNKKEVIDFMSVPEMVDIPELSKHDSVEKEIVAPCVFPNISIYGVVADKIFFSRNSQGENQKWEIGDSLENFQVSKIGKDRVFLLCRGQVYEVLNGQKL